MPSLQTAGMFINNVNTCSLDGLSNKFNKNKFTLFYSNGYYLIHKAYCPI